MLLYGSRLDDTARGGDVNLLAETAAPVTARNPRPFASASVRTLARARIWLFGSRVDDSRRGGDVDLYVEPESVADLTASLREYLAYSQRRLTHVPISFSRSTA